MLIIIMGQQPVFITVFLACIDSSLRKKEAKVKKQEFNILKERSETIKILLLARRKRSSMSRQQTFPILFWTYVSTEPDLRHGEHWGSITKLSVLGQKPLQRDSWSGREKGIFSSESVSCLVVSDSLQPHALQPARLICPWDSPGKNTEVVCHSLLQGIFPKQSLNPRSCIADGFFTVCATREILFSVNSYQFSCPPSKKICPSSTRLQFLFFFFFFFLILFYF